MGKLGLSNHREWARGCSCHRCPIFLIFPDKITGNSRILKWRYCTIYKAIFCGDIPLHRPYIYIYIYIYGRYLQFRFLKWPLIKYNAFLKGMNKLPRGVTKLAYQGTGLPQNLNPQISKVYQSSRSSSCMAGCKPYTYPPVN